MYIFIHAVKLLVYVPPNDAADLRMPIDDGKECVRVIKCHGIQPLAAHLDWLMVQAHERMGIRCRLQVRFQYLQVFFSQVGSIMVGDSRVEEDEMPVAIMAMFYIVD